MLATIERNWTFRQLINFLWSSQVKRKKQLSHLAMMYLSTMNVILLPKWRPKTYSVSKVVFELKICTFEKRVMSHGNEFGHLRFSRNANAKYFYLCQKINGNLHRYTRVETSITQIFPGLNANDIQIPYDKHHKVFSLVKSHQKKPTICQIWTGTKRPNNPAKSQVVIKLAFNPGNECNNKAFPIFHLNI